jgi:hypothetical protein
MDCERPTRASFTKEDIETFILDSVDETELLSVYLEKIRNGERLSDKMIEKIYGFENKNKIKIIAEYNRMMKVLIDIIEDDDSKDLSNAR